MTAEERLERANQLQENARAVFRLLKTREITVEQGRIALELLQLMADLLDLSDTLARRTQAR
jgi:hypothetical protein